MSTLNIKRISRVATAITLAEADLSRLKEDLESNEYLDEMDDFNSLEELAQIIDSDPNAAALVFDVLINSPGYSAPSETFPDDASEFSASLTRGK